MLPKLLGPRTTPLRTSKRWEQSGSAIGCSSALSTWDTVAGALICPGLEEIPRVKKHLPIAAFAAAALVLAGCAASEGGEETDPTPTGTEVPEVPQNDDAATLEAITWEEDDQGVPVLTFDTPSVINAPAARTVNAGDGDAIELGNVVMVHYTVTSGLDGAQVYSTYDQDAPEAIPLSQTSLDPALFDVLSNASVGEDLIFATIDQTAVDTPGAAIYMAMTIVEVVVPLDAAEGAAVTPEEGLPVVTLDESGAPSLEIGDAEMPSELVVQPLIEGEGEELELGQTVIAHYHGWLWDGETFDSSWERSEPASFPFVEGGLIQGWTDGLAGHKVGSQVLLVVPPELGYGQQDQGTIPPGSTLVFVVDILGVF